MDIQLTTVFLAVDNLTPVPASMLALGSAVITALVATVIMLWRDYKLQVKMNREDALKSQELNMRNTIALENNTKVMEKIHELIINSTRK